MGRGRGHALLSQATVLPHNQGFASRRGPEVGKAVRPGLGGDRMVSPIEPRWRALPVDTKGAGGGISGFGAPCHDDRPRICLVGLIDDRLEEFSPVPQVLAGSPATSGGGNRQRRVQQ